MSKTSCGVWMRKPSRARPRNPMQQVVTGSYQGDDDPMTHGVAPRMQSMSIFVVLFHTNGALLFFTWMTHMPVDARGRTSDERKKKKKNNKQTEPTTIAFARVRTRAKDGLLFVAGPSSTSKIIFSSFFSVCMIFKIFFPFRFPKWIINIFQFNSIEN